MSRTTVAQMLSSARERLIRVGPEEAARAVVSGATLIDIRADSQIAAEGTIPGALRIPRNVIEWRLDPTSRAPLPDRPDFDAHLIVFCVAGYASSLVAAVLQELGYSRATDLDGGFEAWRAAGLPVTPPASPG